MKIVVDAKNPFVRETFGRIADVVVLPTTEIVRKNLLDVDAVIIRSETHVGPDLLEGTPVRFVGTATIGTDHIDLPYLRSRGIGFASAPGSNANSVAEYVAAALLVLARRFSFSLPGMAMGVVGVGQVGSRVVRVGRLLGMQVIQNDPPLQRRTGRPEFVSLGEVLHASDIITIHVPLTQEGADPTFHLFNESVLGRMRKGSILVNTSRGGVIPTTHLIDTLVRGHVRGVVLDVWEGEPMISSELLSRSTIGTPHIAGYSLDGKVNAARMMYQAFCRHFGVEEPWLLAEELPPARAALMESRGGAEGGEMFLGETVRECYDIERDDRELRALVQGDPEERARGFRHLRSAYRVRREFSASTVCGWDPASPPARTLAGLGFRLRP